MNDNANGISSLEDTEAILSQMWVEAQGEIDGIIPGEFRWRDAMRCESCVLHRYSGSSGSYLSIYLSSMRCLVDGFKVPM
jgi:hypothetical protein